MYTYVCTYPHMYVQHAHTQPYTHILYLFTCAYIHVHTYLHVHTYILTYICTVHTVCTHNHTHTHTHTVPTCYLSLSAMGPTALTWELRSRRHRVVMSERNWECASMIWSKSEAAETSFCRMAHPHSNTLQRERKGGGKKEECSRRSRS